MTRDKAADEDHEFAPAQEIVFRLERVTDDLDTVSRLLAQPDTFIPDAEKRRMHGMADRISTEVDELFDLATAVAHAQTRIENDDAN